LRIYVDFKKNTKIDNVNVLFVILGWSQTRNKDCDIWFENESYIVWQKNC